MSNVNSNSAISLLLFDLDGTLIDSALQLGAALNYGLTSLGLKSAELDDVRTWIGDGAAILVERALAAQGGKPSQQTELLALFSDYYQQHMTTGLELYPNVRQTLMQLKSQGLRLGVVTNKPSQFIPALLSALELDTIFDAWVGGDTLAQRKPAPEPLWHICEQFTIATENTLMVGDSENDIRAAKAAGIRVVGLSYGYNFGRSLDTANPDWLFDDFAAITTLLGSNS